MLNYNKLIQILIPMENINIGQKECPFLEICYDEMDNDEDQIYRESMKGGSFIEEWESFNSRGRIESIGQYDPEDIENMQQYRAFSESEENRGSMYAKSSIGDDHLITDQQMTTLFDENAIQAE